MHDMIFLYFPSSSTSSKSSNIYKITMEMLILEMMQMKTKSNSFLHFVDIYPMFENSHVKANSSESFYV